MYHLTVTVILLCINSGRRREGFVIAGQGGGEEGGEGAIKRKKNRFNHIRTSKICYARAWEVDCLPLKRAVGSVLYVS